MIFRQAHSALLAFSSVPGVIAFASVTIVQRALIVSHRPVGGLTEASAAA